MALSLEGLLSLMMATFLRFSNVIPDMIDCCCILSKLFYFILGVLELEYKELK
jgi:hypothetical protein